MTTDITGTIPSGTSGLDWFRAAAEAGAKFLDAVGEYQLRQQQDMSEAIAAEGDAGMQAKLGRRTRLTLEVGERNLGAQKFFAVMGFRATNVLRNFYDEWRDEDAYFMQYRLKQGAPAEAASV